MERKSILIIGISSFVGSNLAEFLKKDFKVYGTYRKTPVFIDDVMCFPCDVLIREEVQMAILKIRPDYTIYAVGLSSILECADHPDLADALNTSGLFNVAEFCGRYKSQIIVISSSFVFGGENRDYVEIDIPDAVTIYGKSFASAEFYIQKTSLSYLIFRCCVLYGRCYRPDKLTTFEKMQIRINQNINTLYDANVISGHLDIYYLCMIVKLCLQNNASNRLFQVSSKDHKSFYDFAKTYAKIYDKSESCVGRGKWQFPLQLGPGAMILSDELHYRMDVSNIEGFLNITLPTIEESIRLTKKRFNGAKEKGQSKGDSVKFI